MRLITIIFIFLLFSYQIVYSANQRLISLSPATTEILFALGLKDNIIGNTTFCDYPEEAKNIPKVGTFSEPNIERVISLKPDIVFATGLEQTPSVSKLEQLGLKVIVSYPKSISELLDSIIQIGIATDREKEAKAIVKSMERRIEAIKSKVKNIPKDKRQKAFIEIWYDPIMTVGPGSLVDELLNLAGANNIAYDVPRPYSRFSSETIIERNPDVIILGYMTKTDTKDSIQRRLGWQNIRAVKNNRIVSDIDPSLILRPSPRIIDGLEEIYNRLYE